MINTVFSDNEIPKESIQYICIAAINIDTVMKIGKKNYPQVCLEPFKYQVKKKTLLNYF